LDHLTTFATRVRRLRETAGLSIQDACNRSGLSDTFWGRLERAEQEPCLQSICQIAQGLEVSIPALMTLDDLPSNNTVRNQMNDVLDLCSPAEAELGLRILRVIYDQRKAKDISS
jgi:transcriptional regulator with XRE-family HTH domain